VSVFKIENTKAKLFLLTSSYPYSFSAEAPFLEREVRNLEEKFEIVFVPSLAEGNIYTGYPKDSSIDVSLAKRLRVLFDGTPPEKILRIVDLLWRPGFVTIPLLLSLVRNLKFCSTQGFMRKVLSSAVSDYEGRKWVKRNSLNVAAPDQVIYSYWLNPEALGAAAAARVPVVSRAHHTDLYENLHSPPFFPLRRERVSRLARIFPCSEHGTRHLLSSYPSLGPRVKTKYLATPDMGTSEYDAWGLSKQYLVSCSFLNPVKQVDLIAKALEVIATKLEERNVEWIHFGDGPLKGELDFLVSQISGFSASIRPFPGLPELREFYKTHRVLAFINASKSEGLPVSLMEAASFGIPLIGPNVGGVGEIVHDGVNGYLLENDVSQDQISTAVLRILDLKPEEYQKFRTKSRELWGKNHDSKISHNLFAAELQKIAIGGKPID
jgi:glycosyltransferase involved in cell wall biosynthesis